MYLDMYLFVLIFHILNEYCLNIIGFCNLVYKIIYKLNAENLSTFLLGAAALCWPLINMILQR